MKEGEFGLRQSELFFFFAGVGKEMWGPWGGEPIQQPYGIRVVHLLVFI